MTTEFKNTNIIVIRVVGMVGIIPQMSEQANSEILEPIPPLMIMLFLLESHTEQGQDTLPK